MKSCSRVVAALRACASGRRDTPSSFASSSALARSCTWRVIAVSAGPPLAGLYLKPPSSGGLCEGVTTMPSASPESRPRLWTRIACETAGVGVNSPPAATRTSTPLAGELEDVVQDRIRDVLDGPGQIGRAHV